MEYNIGYNGPPSVNIFTAGIPAKETQVLIGTYDGEEMALYRNGERVGTAKLDWRVQLGEVILAADSDPGGIGQNLDGRLCEVRLYYSSFDERAVGALTNVLD